MSRLGICGERYKQLRVCRPVAKSKEADVEFADDSNSEGMESD